MIPWLLPSVGIVLIILGLALFVIAYFIFRITRSPSIGALFVLVLLVALILVGLGIWLLWLNATASPVPTNSTTTRT